MGAVTEFSCETSFSRAVSEVRILLVAPSLLPRRVKACSRHRRRPHSKDAMARGQQKSVTGMRSGKAPTSVLRPPASRRARRVLTAATSSCSRRMTVVKLKILKFITAMTEILAIVSGPPLMLVSPEIFGSQAVQSTI